jgi:hypothetical protein
MDDEISMIAGNDTGGDGQFYAVSGEGFTVLGGSSRGEERLSLNEFNVIV